MEDTLVLTKPKKSSNSTFKCNAHNGNKNVPFAFQVHDCYVVASKPDVILVKASKQVINMMSRVSDKIVSIMKSNYKSWFMGSNLIDEHIEDYFSCLVVYDKEHGDVLRLRLRSKDTYNFVIKKRVSMTVTLNCVRIFKQKFHTEWSFDNIRFNDDAADFSSELSDTEDLDIPYDEIKDYYLAKIAKERNTVASKLELLDSLRTRVESAEPNNLSTLCDEVNEIVM
jgi:hypothetical protein